MNDVMRPDTVVTKPRAKRGAIVMELSAEEVRDIVQKHVQALVPLARVDVEAFGGATATITKLRQRKPKGA